ncbi:MAG: hypothetical protein Q4B85_05090 [Lachnospiraceae bacterium]|nr:hypothetical protein [Lachnospiraceae bacterium]
MTDNKCDRSLKKSILFSLLFSVVFSGLLCFYGDRVKWSETNEGLLENFSFTEVFLAPGFFVLLAAGFLVFLLLYLYGEKITDFLYRYRYLICLAVFALCLLFEVNGSSIGMWNREGFLGGEDTGLLAGASRAARSDEWFVSTPMALSQYHNPEGAFGYFSTVLRGTATDMFLEYGQPVKDIAVLFRPFHWGYLLFSAGRGLAFFWCGRFLALFMVSFEMGMLVTEKKKDLSVAYGLLMVLSPTVQWWFAVNGLVEMLVFSQLSILCFQHFLKTEKTLARAIDGAVILICAGGFILTLYPAWMIPVALVLLGLIIWQFLENLRYCRMNRWQVLILLAETGVFVAIMVHVFVNSRATVDALMNTVYPGSRFETGGGEGRNLFNYLSELWYPMMGQGTMVNTSESAQFIDFFPLCYVIPAVVLIRDKVKDKLLIILLVFSAFLEIYMIFGIPDILAAVSLMSYSTAHRTLQVVGFCNLLLLFRGMALLKKRIHPVAAAVLAVVTVVAGMLQNYRVYGGYYQGRVAIAVIAVLVFIPCFWLCMSGTEKYFRKLLLALVLVISLISGGLANPVRLSVKNITENPNVLEIETVVKEDPKAVWAIEGLGVPMINAGIIAGAPTMNSTNIYPELERWRKLDGGEHEEVYNRYAHILVNLQVEGEPSFELFSEDYFQFNCTLDHLRTMGVRYVLTAKDLAGYTQDPGNITLTRSWGPYRVYQIQ